MDADARSALIAKYKAGYAEVVKALDGFPAAQLTARPFPGKWTAAEIVHHLADSETQSATRLRKLLAEPHPVIQAYDQEEWTNRLHYQSRQIEPALLAFRAARETTAQLLDLMTEADWRKLGWHSESGSYHSERWLEIYAEHAHGHAAQIARLKAALAK
ncbi:MAG TPA: DinB family protein [Candidatus Eisenbacteria bacterium]